MPDDWSPLDTVGGGRRPWFGRKRIGWGWSPGALQGYLFTTGLLVAIEAILVGTRAGWAIYLVAAIPVAVGAIKAAARRLVRRLARRR